ncbi:MAG: VCBS repeat-containing protein [Alphaproteobacteria bacterium]|nr:VCBS repeat-containing protein [Alphaproteobacteria bacterium]
MLPLLLIVLACGDKDAGDTGVGATDTTDADTTDGDDTDGGATDSGGTDGGDTDSGGTDSGGTDSGGTDSGSTDCPDPVTWYYDADGDGYGDDALSTDACEQPRGYVDQVGDCDDIDPTVRPGASEICGNTVDEDCDGTAQACAVTLAPSGDIDSVAWVFPGEATDDQAGAAVRIVPDMDGDGLPDVMVGAPQALSSTGKAYLVQGPFTGDGTLAAADAVLSSLEATSFGRVGNDVDGADLDGDGLPDLVVGAHNVDDGELYVVSGPVSGAIAADDVGVVITAGSGSVNFGGSFRTGLDLTGDGLTDLIAGTQGDDGDVYVIPGPITAGGAADAVGHTLFRVPDGRNDGWHIELGDVDGDGIGDAVVAAPDDDGETYQSGEIRVVLGPITGDSDLSDADSTLSDSTVDNFLGWGLGIGDLDGDGKDDIAAGGPIADAGGGVVLVFHGTPPAGAVDSSGADLVVRGTGLDFIGLDVDIGDVDGDGVGDLVAAGAGGSTIPGALHVFLAPGTGTLATSDADRQWTGLTGGGFLGFSLDMGDLDGDGADEVVVGETREDSKSPLPGQLWVVKGAGW